MLQGTLKGKAGELVDRALAIDPRNRKALALAATAASERHDYDGALARWRALAAQLPPGSDAVREVAQAIADVEQQRDAARAAPGTPATATGRAPAAPPKRRGDQRRPRGDVSLAPELASRASPDDTVFIFARAVDGPRMPLAVMRTTVRALPQSFTLDDSMAMAPGATISSAREVVVEARVSKRGSATPASGDLIGKSLPVAPGSDEYSRPDRHRKSLIRCYDARAFPGAGMRFRRALITFALCAAAASAAPAPAPPSTTSTRGRVQPLRRRVVAVRDDRSRCNARDRPLVRHRRRRHGPRRRRRARARALHAAQSRRRARAPRARARLFLRRRRPPLARGVRGGARARSPRRRARRHPALPRCADVARSAVPARVSPLTSRPASATTATPTPASRRPTSRCRCWDASPSPTSACSRAAASAYLAGGVQYTHPVAPGGALFIGGAGTGKFYFSESEFNLAQVAVNAGGTFRSDADTFALTYRLRRDPARRRQLPQQQRRRARMAPPGRSDDHVQRHAAGRAHRLLRRQRRARFRFRGARRRHAPRLAGARGSRCSTRRCTAAASATARPPGARPRHLRRGRRRHGVAVAVLGTQRRLRLSAQQLQRRYPLIDTTRHDDNYVASLGALYLFARNWSARLEYQYQRNDSNLELYDYSRNLVTVKLRYDFK